MVGRVTATNHLEKNKSGKRYRNTVALCFTGEIFRCTVVHKSCHQLSQYQYSTTSVIRTSIIRHLNYPNAKFHKPHLHLRKPHVSWRLQNMAFSNRQSNTEHRKCIDYRREAESRQSTIVAKSWKIQENGWHRWISLIWTNSLTYPNKFTYVSTSQVYHDRRCLDNRRMHCSCVLQCKCPLMSVRGRKSKNVRHTPACATLLRTYSF